MAGAAPARIRTARVAEGHADGLYARVRACACRKAATLAALLGVTAGIAPISPISPIGTAVARAAGSPILHEPLPAPELRCQGGACTREGQSASALPEAVVGSDGMVTAPSPHRTPDPHEQVYTGQTAGALPLQRGAPRPGGDPPPLRRGHVSMDADTGPEQSGERVYHEVFNPAVFPYKRMTVLDAVGEDGALVAADSRRVPILPQGPRLRAGRDPFYGSVMMEFSAGQEISLPTPAAGLRLLSYQATPASGVRFFLDGAENLYARAERAGSFRLIYLVDAEQRYFAGPLWPGAGGRHPRLVSVPQELLRRLPRRIEHDAERVLRRIGVRPTPDADYGEILDKLVGYFRAFKLGELDTSGSDSLYLALALQQLGACRHRAYAFVITALAAGIPARYVENELHVFVEVYIPALGDRSSYWRRINLGGAPLRQRVEGGEAKVAYQEKGGDPFERPASFRGSPAPSVSGELPRRGPGSRRDGDRSGGLPSLDGPEDRARRGEGGPGRPDRTDRSDRPDRPDRGDPKSGEKTAGDPGTGQTTGQTGDGGRGDRSAAAKAPGSGEKAAGPGGPGSLDFGKQDPGGDGDGEALPAAPPADDVQRPEDTRSDAAAAAGPLIGTRISVAVGSARPFYRGMAVPVRGAVTTTRGSAAGLEVVLILAIPGAPITLGRARTDASGAYQTEVEIPADTPLGRFPLVARVRGDETRRGSTTGRYDALAAPDGS